MSAEAGLLSPHPRKILFVASDPGGSISGVKVLGKLPEGNWVSADPAGALALFAKDTSARILFRDEADYRDRVKGLPEAKRPARMAYPYSEVKDNAENEMVSELIEDTRKNLQALATGACQAGSSSGKHRAWYDSGFRLVEDLDPDTRMASWDAFTLVDGLRNDFARLNDESAALRWKFPGLVQADTLIESERERLMVAMDAVMNRIHPNHRPASGLHRTPGPADWVRGIYATPYDSVLAHPINGEEAETAVRWGDGVVTTQEERNIQYTERRGLKVRILYLDGGEFVRDIAAFDTTQWPGIFSKRLKPIAAGDIANHLAVRQCYLIRDAVNRLRYLESKEPALSKRIAAHIPLERSEQVRLLGDYSNGKVDLGKIRLAWSGQIRELEFSLAWARQARWFEAIPRFERALAQAKELRRSLDQ